MSKIEKKLIPDGGYGWVVLVGSFFISFMIDGIMYSFGPIIDEIQVHFNTTEGETNLIQSLNTGFLFCSGPIVAGLTSTFGCRDVIMGGAIVTSFLYFFCVFSPGIVPIWIFYGVFGGISTGCTYISSLIVIPEYFDKKLGFANGVVMAGSGVGSAVVPNAYFGLRYFIEHYDWKFAMSICASAILLCFGFGAFLKPLNRSASKVKQNTVQTFTGSTYSLSTEQRGFFPMLISMFKETVNIRLLGKNTGLVLITVSNFCLFTGYFLTYRYLTQIAEKSAGMSDPTVLLSLIGALNIPFRIFFGLIVDAKVISAINLNTLCILFSTIPYFFYQKVLQYEKWGQYLFSTVFAIGGAGMNSLTTAYLLDIVGFEKFGNATGIVNLFRGAGCFLGPFIAGKMLDYYKWEKAMAFYFSAVCYLLGFIFTALCSLWCMARTPNDCQDVNEKVDLMNSPGSNVVKTASA